MTSLGGSERISVTEVVDALSTLEIPIAILNACESGRDVGIHGNIAKTLASKGVSVVVAMSFQVTVEAAVLFVTTLYSSLLQSGTGFVQAISNARDALRQHRARRARFYRTIDVQDWIVPVVYTAVNPQESIFDDHVPSKSARPVIRSTNESWTGFVGRDMDIFRIESQLLENKKNNIVLLRGAAGIGKTFFLRYLGDWWQRTGLIKSTIFLDFESNINTVEEICRRIAEIILPNGFSENPKYEVSRHN